MSGAVEFSEDEEIVEFLINRKLSDDEPLGMLTQFAAQLRHEVPTYLGRLKTIQLEMRQLVKELDDLEDLEDRYKDENSRAVRSSLRGVNKTVKKHAQVEATRRKFAEELEAVREVFRLQLQSLLAAEACAVEARTAQTEARLDIMRMVTDHSKQQIKLLEDEIQQILARETKAKGFADTARMLFDSIKAKSMTRWSNLMNNIRQREDRLDFLNAELDRQMGFNARLADYLMHLKQAILKARAEAERRRASDYADARARLKRRFDDARIELTAMHAESFLQDLSARVRRETESAGRSRPTTGSRGSRGSHGSRPGSRARSRPGTSRSRPTTSQSRPTTSQRLERLGSSGRHRTPQTRTRPSNSRAGRPGSTERPSFGIGTLDLPVAEIVDEIDKDIVHEGPAATIFLAADQNNDGLVSLTEIIKAVQANSDIANQLGLPKKSRELAALLDAVKRDPNGRITLPAWVKGVNDHMAAVASESSVQTAANPKDTSAESDSDGDDDGDASTAASRNSIQFRGQLISKTAVMNILRARGKEQGNVGIEARKAVRELAHGHQLIRKKQKAHRKLIQKMREALSNSYSSHTLQQILRELESRDIDPSDIFEHQALLDALVEAVGLEKYPQIFSAEAKAKASTLQPFDIEPLLPLFPELRQLVGLENAESTEEEDEEEEEDNPDDVMDGDMGRSLFGEELEDTENRTYFPAINSAAALNSIPSRDIDAFRMMRTTSKFEQPAGWKMEKGTKKMHRAVSPARAERAKGPRTFVDETHERFMAPKQVLPSWRRGVF